jgi:hypothetical protein
MKIKRTYAAQGGRSGPSLHQPGLSIVSLLNSIKRNYQGVNMKKKGRYLWMSFYSQMSCNLCSRVLIRVQTLITQPENARANLLMGKLKNASHITCELLYRLFALSFAM